jgi:hypothetical protein
MTNNKQKTPVEWLESRITALIPNDIGSQLMYKNNIKKAKEMQKQITIKLYNDYENYLEEAFKHQNGGQAVILSFQEFYEQNYGGNK